MLFYELFMKQTIFRAVGRCENVVVATVILGLLEEKVLLLNLAKIWEDNRPVEPLIPTALIIWLIS